MTSVGPPRYRGQSNVSPSSVQPSVPRSEIVTQDTGGNLHNPRSHGVSRLSQSTESVHRVSQAAPTYVPTYGLTQNRETYVNTLAFRNAHEKDPDIEIEVVGDHIAETVNQIKAPTRPTRYAVLNREPRVEIPKWVRAGIYHRDGQACIYCYTNDSQLVLDHIVPRSSFPADQLHIADRSDNLATACWDCNEGKSNYTVPHRELHKPGITHTCPDCLTNLGCDWGLDDGGPYVLPAFCLRHGAVTQVPNAYWIG